MFLTTLPTACSQSADDHELAAARTRWVDHRQISYAFTWQQSCECIGDMTRPISIDVTSEHITSAAFVDDQRPVGEPVLSRLRTVAGIFDEVRVELLLGIAGGLT